MDNRVDLHTYMMVLAKAAALRGTCPRRKVGAVLAAEGRVVSTGYNGSPAGEPHCVDVEHGCLLNDSGNCIRTVHAEMNALLQGRGDALYCTDQPCLRCLQAAINNGVKKIYYERPYPDHDRDTFVIAHQCGWMFHQMDMSHVIVEVGG